MATVAISDVVPNSSFTAFKKRLRKIIAVGGCAVRKRIPRPKLLRIDQLKAVDIDQPTVGDL
jgi:hypothetical protein